MKLIKLSAIPSTNDYIKEMSSSDKVENFTTVWAEFQTKGRGQMGTQWNAEVNKSLTFSVLVNYSFQIIENIYSFNALVVCALLNAFEDLNLTKVYVKWPNDILAGNKKIAGVLIENTFKGQNDIQSVVGIGINLNQMHFDDLPQAGSILSVFNQIIDPETLLRSVVSNLEQLFNDFPNNSIKLWDLYHENLFRKDIVSAFELPDGKQMSGIIKGVDIEGYLKVIHEEDIEKRYGLKEIKLLY